MDHIIEKNKEKERPIVEALSVDHRVLDGARQTRRYFAKFERIIDHLDQVALLSAKERLITVQEAAILQEFLEGLANTFSALSYKFLMANRVGNHSEKLLTIDKSESGFPVFGEVLQMAADAMQAKDHLRNLPDQKQLKKDMINHILSEHNLPLQLQYALSQRIYYEYLKEADLFLSQNDPQTLWLGKSLKGEVRNYLVYWAVYDSQTNIPTIYMMHVEDSGSRALTHDERRWPRVQSHLMAQSVSGLNLLTIASGFDDDFDKLHPKWLKRFHLGPMYSHTFTTQTGPLRDILADVSAEPGYDWALTWTTESLFSKGQEKEKKGLFGSVNRQVFKIDKTRTELADAGLSDMRRSLIMPHKTFQILQERDPASLRRHRKYVVGDNQKVLSLK